MSFTYVKRAEICHGNATHISHLFQYVSAYELTKETLSDLINDIEQALIKARTTVETQIVHQDGECCLHITPTGYIILMLPWKVFTLFDEKD